MKYLNGTKKSRFKVTIYIDAFLGCVTLYAMHLGQETVATTAIAGVLTITTMYIGGDSYRKSE